MIPYHGYACQLLEQFEDITIGHVPRNENKQADALANLAATLALPEEKSTTVPVCRRWVLPPLAYSRDEHQYSNVVSVFEIEIEDWRQSFIDYLQYEKLPDDLKHRTEIQRRVP